MSVLLECQSGDVFYSLEEFYASPDGEPFSSKTSREFAISEQLRFVSLRRDPGDKDRLTGWLVIFEAADEKRYAASQSYFATTDTWKNLRSHFKRSEAKKKTERDRERQKAGAENSDSNCGSAIEETTKRMSTQELPPRNRRLWLWFAAGFALTFVGIAAFVSMFIMHPSGEAVVRCPLWAYYITQVPRLFRSEFLGPGRFNSEQFYTTVIQHVLFSIGGGLVATGIGWAVHKMRVARPNIKG